MDMIRLHLTDWVGTELESDDTCELELDRGSRTQRGIQQPLLTSVLSLHYRTTNCMGAKWIAPNKQQNPLKQCHLCAVNTPWWRAISPAAQMDCEPGNTTPSMAPGQHQEIPFSRWNKKLVWIPRTTCVFHACLPVTLQSGGLAASHISHLEGRELRCYEAPNQRGATSCLQGATSFKFLDESL